MRLFNFIDGKQVRLGAQVGDLYVDAALLPGVSAPGTAGLTTEDVIHSPDLLAQLRTALQTPDPDVLHTVALPRHAVRYAPCVLRPEKILCIGLNYRRHAAESGMPVPEVPLVFSKFSNSLTANGSAVPLPATAVQYDYEVELGVVIGRQVRGVGIDEALDAVFGYCCLNDLSARDLQMRTSQWLLGKTLDRFLPAGPYLVTSDEVPDPQNLALKCWVNGELRQDSSTADMVFSVAQIVSYVSQYMTLQPGDLIATGTPEGVIFGKSDPVWLKPGDETVVEIERLGRLTNRCTEAI